MKGDDLLSYAGAEIARLRLGGSNACVGVRAEEAEGEAAVLICDGVGLEVVCRTREDVNAVLAEAAESREW